MTNTFADVDLNLHSQIIFMHHVPSKVNLTSDFLQNRYVNEGVIISIPGFTT